MKVETDIISSIVVSPIQEIIYVCQDLQNWCYLAFRLYYISAINRNRKIYRASGLKQNNPWSLYQSSWWAPVLWPKTSKTLFVPVKKCFFKEPYKNKFKNLIRTSKFKFSFRGLHTLIPYNLVYIHIIQGILILIKLSEIY
jgi:hypothetical protein